MTFPFLQRNTDAIYEKIYIVEPDVIMILLTVGIYYVKF